MEKTTNIISFSENKEEIKRENCLGTIILKVSGRKLENAKIDISYERLEITEAYNYLRETFLRNSKYVIQEVSVKKCFKLEKKIVLNTKTQITYYEVNGKIYSEAFPKRNIVALTQIILLTLLSLQ